MSDKLKIIFMGTPDFAVAALQDLIDSPHEVIGVYTQPPRPKGRGHKVTPSPAEDLARAHDIAVYTPKSLKTPEAQAEFVALGADMAVVAAYGLILPLEILEAPRFGCLNIHASLLPCWRGASPIQHAIWKGDSHSGVTIMQMDEGLDTGAMIAKRSTPIEEGSTTLSLHSDLCKIGGELLLEVLEQLVVGEILESQPQNEGQMSYAPLLSKEDGRVEWSQNAEEIERQIRALNPWPGVWSEIDGVRVKILQAELVQGGGDAPAGRIVSKEGHVSCGDGRILKLLRVQPQNAKAMDFASAVNGGYIAEGQHFS